MTDEAFAELAAGAPAPVFSKEWFHVEGTRAMPLPLDLPPGVRASRDALLYAQFMRRTPDPAVVYCDE